MRSVSRFLKYTLAAAAGLALSLALSTSAAPAAPAAPGHAPPPAAATWDLGGGEQRLCIPAGEPWTSYFVGFIAGSWSTPLTAEVDGFPAGTETSMTTTVPPGDNGDSYIGTVWIGVRLPPLAFGEYPAELTVTDGTSTQTMRILIKAQEAWGC
ncbi:hypothetical protein GCM10009853_032710 [Glycomyces scopariae]|uniref:Secreted protein n=1 Tax=Glycomyces sambucus TaxID=380244 RepID=A0A1G9CRR4_9ACTN|nr:DUF5980 family protein [Glycomyces sambucus]SDK54094.1 hypothetical protein SAMN05216298_0469 [Glycomyces sambucus]